MDIASELLSGFLLRESIVVVWLMRIDDVAHAYHDSF
jgi:hypothetical protein